MTWSHCWSRPGSADQALAQVKLIEGLPLSGEQELPDVAEIERPEARTP
jgi:hypothetical protein